MMEKKRPNQGEKIDRKKIDGCKAELENYVYDVYKNEVFEKSGNLFIRRTNLPNYGS